MSDPRMKLLLVGPYPPPHGGISVHVATAYRLLRRSGAACRVLDADGRHGPGSARSGRPGRWRRWSRLSCAIRRHARAGWTLHLHTNGHNPRSWLTVLGCGRAARSAPARLVTLHSGMVPEYLSGGGAGRRLLVRLALGPYDRVLCVNPRIREAVAALGIAPDKLEVAPAYLPSPPPATDAALPPPAVEAWLRVHRPVLVSTLWFRPEYGFDVLIEALARLAPRHPSLGCLVLGGGEGEEAARRQLRERGLEERVLVAGDVSHTLCLALMARADLFVRPSLTDGDALSVREALSLGLPVVATDTDGRPGGIAALVPPGDAAALAAAIETALAPGPEAEAFQPSAGVAGGVESLLHTYREVACAAR
ncbi:MAG TPA: glycosyltransferase family 4 protein [Thermoanaerobaculia bacterium]